MPWEPYSHLLQMLPCAAPPTRLACLHLLRCALLHRPGQLSPLGGQETKSPQQDYECSGRLLERVPSNCMQRTR